MKKSIIKCMVLTATVACIGAGTSNAQSKSSDLKNFPKGSTPKEIGMLVANRFLESPHPNFGRPTPPVRISYPEVCAWYRALTFGTESNNKQHTQ